MTIINEYAVLPIMRNKLRRSNKWFNDSILVDMAWRSINDYRQMNRFILEYLKSKSQRFINFIDFISRKIRK